MNHPSDIRTAGINWRRGALRLWVIASVLWCAVVFSVVSVGLTTDNVSWFPADSPATIHVRISDSETWDYPANWGVQRIRDDLRKRLAAADEKKYRDWAAQVPAARKAECRAIPPTTPFADEPDDCVRLAFVNDVLTAPLGRWSEKMSRAPKDVELWVRSSTAPKDWVRAVPMGWESQIRKAPMSAWWIIAVAMAWAVGPPLVVLAFGASLLWAFAGFRRSSL